MKINWWNSLQVKIIAWSFVPIVIILAGVAWFTFNSNQKVIIDAALKEDQTIVQEKMGQVTAAIGGIIDTAIIPVIMEIDTNHDAPLEVRAQNIVDHAQGLEIFDGGLYFLDQNGVIYKTWPDLPELLGQDWSGTPQFRAVQAAPNIAVFSDLIPLESTGKMLLCTGAAMLGKDVTAAGPGS